MDRAADSRDVPNISGGEAIEQYVQQNPISTNVELLSFLALLGAYVPNSYLLMSECQSILGPPDPIHGGPPFEERMKPFTALINISVAGAERRCSIVPGTAHEILNRLANLKTDEAGITNVRFTRSCIVKNLILSLFDSRLKAQYIKDLLTKREMGDNGKKEQFSRLITDITEENFQEAVSVVGAASKKFKQDPFFPQTISRLYYKKEEPNYEQAERWAKEAIKRAPDNSYVADTLGQIYKNMVKKQTNQDIEPLAYKAFEAFESVEKKAEKEYGLDTEDAESNANSFNDRGLFGFMQVAMYAWEKYPDSQKESLIQSKGTKVKETFEFFEWYLAYSAPDKGKLEPSYFWGNVATCYEYYTGESAAESTSFAGLYGDQMGAGLEDIHDALKQCYEETPDDVDVAQRYILSNIILSNRMPDSPHIAQVTELKGIITRFLHTVVGHRSPEFYLLVLLLFWPEVEQNQNVTLDLNTYATYMEKAFERAKHAKYLRGRYLLPLFFLGKGSGLSKWIHKSRLDAIVEKQHDNEREMWEIPEVHDMLLPVRVEPCPSPTTAQELSVCVGGRKIKATKEDETKNFIFYLGFTIRGPVVFKVTTPRLTQN